MKKWDVVIKNGQVFDGSGELPSTVDIAINSGLIVEIGQNLPTDSARKFVDASGKWVMPGLLDIHTHYDLEVELSPGLPESVRHGTTTVVMSNCSLGTAFGSQRKDGDDPIIDCFTRVENMPKPVLRLIADKMYWDNTADYLTHLDTLPLGPNVVPMIPHSMLRIEVMGLENSISRKPTPAELDKMTRLLENGLKQGYAGFSTDGLPFHYLANDPNRRKRIPTQFANHKELRALTNVVRQYDRVWQATPPADSIIKVFRSFALSSGLLNKGKALKTTAVAAIDVFSDKTVIKKLTALTTIINKLLRGNFQLQALAAPFKVWSDGFHSPLSEEIPELRELLEPDMEEQDARMALLSDPDFIERFTAMWMKGKSNPSAFKRNLRNGGRNFSRDMDDMHIDNCPLQIWEGKTFTEAFNQVKSNSANLLSAPEWANYKDHFKDLKNEADFVLATQRAFDLEIVWYYVSGNRNPKVTRELVMNPIFLPGFNDSGAHLTNMAFYDCNLRALKLANQGGLKDTAYMVRRLTRDPADLFGIAAGRLEIGQQADVTIIDPKALMNYDGEANIQRIYRDEFQHEQLVNRSDGVVTNVFIAGHEAWSGTQYSPDFAKTKMGRFLPVNENSKMPLVAE